MKITQNLLTRFIRDQGGDKLGEGPVDYIKSPEGRQQGRETNTSQKKTKRARLWALKNVEKWLRATPEELGKELRE